MRVLRNRGAAGVDKLTLAAVEEYGVGPMKRLREKVKARTGSNRVGVKDIRTVIEDLNPILRGWGNYFRTGNAADKFRQIDWYVVGRLRGLMVKKRGRNLRAGQTRQWTEDWFQRVGPAPVARHRPIPRDGVAQSGRSSVSRVRENRTHGIERGMGKRTRKGTAPLTTND
jgi:Group II intron, maturase-specific domain